jgi:hypothetical protein
MITSGVDLHGAFFYSYPRFSMKIATWNVNSIRARMERLCAWLAAQAPDVLCLQETKVEDNVFPALDLESLSRGSVWPEDLQRCGRARAPAV